MSELIRISNFPTPAAQRANHVNLAKAADYNDSAWSILYGALVNGYGVSPETFQMTYPYIAWDWPTQNLGYIGSDQYDTLSVIPAFSAVGEFKSTGVRFNDQYRAFLNVILADSTDPGLKKKIADLYDDLVEVTNRYDRTLQQAVDAYEADTSPSRPDFTAWLGTIAGKSWQTKVNSLAKEMSQAEANYAAAVGEAKTPNLTEALEAFGDPQYYAKLNDPTLTSMPAVPNWTTPITSHKWADKAARGDVAGGSIGFSNSDSTYDYSKTWAKGSAKVGSSFWSVKVGGSWSRVETFESDRNLNASIQFEAAEQILIQPGPWYTGTRALANGPYKRGYSEFGGDGTQAVFGDDGFLPMVKTGMLVVYKPSFLITVNQSTFSSFQEQFEACVGLRIGPFEFGASGGSVKAGWKASKSGLNFSGQSDSTTPFIVGFSIQKLPTQ